MADTKITALTAISTVDPAVDVLPIVDVSDTTMAASGTTKKITSNQILGAGGTATLASATITGDLTVDTSTLKVDSANNRVGIRTASPAATLSVVGVAGTGNTVAGISGNTDSGLLSIGNDNSNGGAGTQTWTGSAQSYAAAISFGQVNTTGVREQIRTHATVFSTNIQSFGRADLVIATKGSLDNNDPTEKYRIASDGVATWSNVGGVAGTAMTLNSTGLGVGKSPAQKLDVNGTIQTSGYLFFTTPSASIGAGTTNSSWLEINSGTNFNIRVNGGDRLLVDTSGNVGVGVTPINKLQVAASALAAIPAAGASGHMFAIGSTPYGIAAGALTSGNSYIQATRWDGTATNYDLLLQPNGGNLGFNGLSFGGGSNVIFIGNGTAPSSNPTAGGILYVEAGALKYRGSSGTITTLANA
jgi:hypothetical protein